MAPKVPVPNPAADKLPLAVRKNVRDEWESKKPEIEERISKALGETWTISVNPNLLYANTDDEGRKSNIGAVIYWYFEPFATNVESFVQSFGDDGKAELNNLVSEHRVEFVPQDETTFTYGGLQIKDGVLRLVFALGNLAVNVSDVSRDFTDALKKAAASGSGNAFNIVARNAVREDYDTNIEAIQEAIGKLVGVPDIKLNGNFEKNAAALAKAGDKVISDWDRGFGDGTYGYFEGLKGQLEYKGFKDDDMLQEGFQEGVSKNEIQLRVVDKLTKGSYHELFIEDGVLVIQTVPENWRTNVSYVGEDILEIL
ncbi:uncharacterized protein A1O9_04257 [Exophiala aquamarina CBS 119918]|uniref:Uncharacterized protein n=1 Tax=Exophiala aquamarina CBS 119918 TaxID=1182545 RepID=A0A072PJC7_9EURO|nr:uncharacterized protein A1O9_04257 [Exophiala aquamarina CBS 119918]KEF59413.1 hypothetical protein A1O9_04257 [Exophiala aquamarina CBS 119918]